MVSPVAPKLIALDLDETTLTGSPTFLPQSGALEAAISRGIQIVIASGRSLDTLPREMTLFRDSLCHLRQRRYGL